MSLANGHDVLGLMPTGGGKSITFQVTAMAKQGLCLVITPLIALMKDQVENLRKKGIKAMYVHAGMSRDEMDIAFNNCAFGEYKFLYLSPERINTELFITRLKKMTVNLIAVDEAHCISQWGYDFRPSYLRIALIRKEIPDIPVLALTGSATPEVIEDIQEKLLFRKKNVFSRSFERKNISFIVRKVENKEQYLLKIIDKAKGSGIIYVRSRKKSRAISEMLNKKGISADYYHAGLSSRLRNYKQNLWKSNGYRIIVATNAFGMGIDKPDVRFVLHSDMPDSLEEYFQEAGRAGRDGKIAFAVLLYNDNDISVLKKRIKTNFPEIAKVKSIYQALGNYYKLAVGSGKNNIYDFKIADFAGNYKYDILTVYNSMKILQRQGYIEFTDEIQISSKVYFCVNREDLYKFQVKNEDLDGFIKLLLRSYTGLFTEYTAIDEDILAKRANTQVDTIYQYLDLLRKANIIKYIPQRRSPIIIFTEERLDEKSLIISKESYLDRKKRYESRVMAVIRYATGDRCRNQELLNYFGEKHEALCGRCDICKEKNEQGLNKYDFENIKEKIEKNLKQNKYSLEKLIEITGSKEDKVIKVVQWMADNRILLYDDQNRLTLNL